jgi:hypothetical protein
VVIFNVGEVDSMFWLLAGLRRCGVSLLHEKPTGARVDPLDVDEGMTEGPMAGVEESVGVTEGSPEGESVGVGVSEGGGVSDGDGEGEGVGGRVQSGTVPSGPVVSFDGSRPLVDESVMFGAGAGTNASAGGAGGGASIVTLPGYADANRCR